MRGLEFHHTQAETPPSKELAVEIGKIRRASEAKTARRMQEIFKTMYALTSIREFVEEQPDYERQLEEAHHPESDEGLKAKYGRHRPAV